jgi:hypothetical protein
MIFLGAWWKAMQSFVINDDDDDDDDDACSDFKKMHC